MGCFSVEKRTRKAVELVTEHHGTAVSIRNAGSSTSTAARRLARMMGVGAVTVGMVGVFALPAYASPVVEGQPDLIDSSQMIVTEDAEGQLPAVKVAAQEAPKPEPAAVGSTGVQASAGWLKDIPAGSGAQGLVAAARAQVGVNQDCTDLVQNSLAKIGLTQSRLDGGRDLGVNSFYAFGRQVTDGKYAPGDILLWPGQPHAAIYIGNGLAVHGGYGGNTVIAGYKSYNQEPTAVIRVG